MSDESGREHFASAGGELTPHQRQLAAQTAAVEAHMARAAPAADVLLTRARILVRGGVDLRHPERMTDFVDDQVMDAIDAATVHDCGCTGAQGAAALALLAEVTARLAAEMEGRGQ